MIRPKPKPKQSVRSDQTASPVFECQQGAFQSSWKVSSGSAFTVLSRAGIDDTQKEKSVPHDSGASESTGSDQVVGNQSEGNIVREPWGPLTVTGRRQGVFIFSAALCGIAVSVCASILIKQLLACVGDGNDPSVENSVGGWMLRR